MTKKIATPIAIQFNSEEESREIVDGILSLGYEISTPSATFQKNVGMMRNRDWFVINDYYVGWNENDDKRLEINKSNKELILALATMQADDEFHAGEWVTPTSAFGFGGYNKGELAKVEQKAPRVTYSGFPILPKGRTSGFVTAGLKYWRKATAAEIIAHFKTNKPMETKPIIGYNIKPGHKKNIDFIALALNTHTSAASTHYWLPTSGGVYNKAVEMGVLDVWFEPVYKEQKVILNLGSNGAPITIEGKNIICRGEHVPINLLEKLVSMSQNSMGRTEGLEGFGFYLAPDVRCIRVGCISENHRFSLDEINQVIDVYKKINP